MIRANLGNSTSGREQSMGMRERSERATGTPTLVRLQKALRPKPCDWVYDWQTLPPEYPAGHRKAYRRIAQMHHSHKSPQSGSTRGPSGEESISDSIETIATRLRASKAQQCH